MFPNINLYFQFNMTDAASHIPATSPSMAREDDNFERDLKEMLKEGPVLGDMSNTVQSGQIDLGQPRSIPRQPAPPSSLPTSISDSYASTTATSPCRKQFCFYACFYY